MLPTRRVRTQECCYESRNKTAEFDPGAKIYLILKVGFLQVDDRGLLWIHASSTSEEVRLGTSFLIVILWLNEEKPLTPKVA